MDDVFALVQDREAAEQLLRTMNSVHENIKFEIEHPSQTNSLSLLDFTVTIDTQGEAAFKFYRKPARSNVFMNARTALPSRVIHNVVRNERRRIIERCTSIGEAEQHLQTFEQMLALNDHQPNNSHRSNPRTNTHPRRINNETFFIQLPFISNKIDHAIRRVFKNNKLEVIPFYKNKNLRSILAKKDNEDPPCNITNCPLNEPTLCLKKNVVYQVECNRCHGTYIGSTIRPLHQRIKEHLQQTNSAVFQHLSSCGPSQGIKVTTLTRERDSKNLRIKEGILIAERAPTMNKKEEEAGLISLIKIVL